MADETTLTQVLADYVLPLGRDGAPDEERRFVAWERVHDWIDSDPEQAWRFIETAYRSDISDQDLLNVAAGPLEDFLDAHGEQYFERLETALRRDARSRFMVAGVWTGGMSNALRERFVAMRERFGIKPL